MGSKMTLADALKEALEDDNTISKYEAKVIHELVARHGGYLSEEEHSLLSDALEKDHFDAEGLRILNELLLKSDLRRRKK